MLLTDRRATVRLLKEDGGVTRPPVSEQLADKVGLTYHNILIVFKHYILGKKHVRNGIIGPSTDRFGTDRTD